MSVLLFDPITYAVIELVKKAVSKTDDATKNGDLAALQTEEARQEISCVWQKDRPRWPRKLLLHAELKWLRKLKSRSFTTLVGKVMSEQVPMEKVFP